MLCESRQNMHMTDNERTTMSAANSRNMMTMGEIFDRLHQLPAIPAVVQVVMGSFRNVNLDTGTLAHQIAQDQGLSARVLRVANSSFYGMPRKIGSIQDAVMVMGFDSVRSLVLSVSFMHAFPPAPHDLFDRTAYWKRCLRVACYTDALAQCLKRDQQTAFTAGLFYEIGLLVLDVCAPELFADLLQQQKTSGLSLIEIEQSALGFDHAEIGAELARRWNFPQKIEQAIRHWRTPEHDPFEPVAGMVHVAALLEGGWSGEKLMERLPDTLRNRLQISWKRIAPCLPEADRLDAGVDSVLSEVRIKHAI